MSDSLSMKFKWQWDFGDGTKTDGITATHCFEEPGSYYIQLNFVNLITGRTELNQASYLLDVEKIVQPYIAASDIAYIGEDVNMSADLTNLPGWNIASYYWNFDDDSFYSGQEVTKKFTRPGKFNLQLIISSVPDANGVIKEACVCKDIIIKERNK
jgi:PKD repeat protein